MALQRLAQTLSHLNGSSTISLIHGPTAPALQEINLGQLLEDQASKYGSKTALICSSTQTRLTYEELRQRSANVARGLLALGVRYGDVVGIMAGNCAEYVELFFAAGKIGAILSVFNNTYTPDELKSALLHTGCKVFFSASELGKHDNTSTLTMLESSMQELPELELVVMLESNSPFKKFSSYEQIMIQGKGISEDFLISQATKVTLYDVCNLQFTSGTTGKPKAAMLTHHNVINNAVFIGDRMGLVEKDILCCPPPLFHCFGLVLGLLAVITHGCTIVFPSPSFDAQATLKAVLDENCTALHGVPAMWSAEMDLVRPENDFSSLRTGIAAGSATTSQMMADLQAKLNLTQLTNTYGMTETSPASFMTSCNDPLERRLTTVGRIFPHTSAKIVDQNGDIVPLGSKGELCVAGYLLQKGYWRNTEKTNEVMIRDTAGLLWMHTGDEASFDADGYCKITGRIKDMIIRGGENIFPLEIEERLLQHPDISNASVVGIKDKRYGETVAAFIQSSNSQRLSKESIQRWVREKLGRHKAPEHVFYLGEEDVGNEFPLTGSGKVKKHILRDLGDRLVEGRNKMPSAHRELS